jgi:hypothetical protein
MLVLQALDFNLRPKLPYSQCMIVMNKLFGTDDKPGMFNVSKEVRRKVAQYAWWFLNASLKSTLCLTASVMEISLACIQAASDFAKVSDNANKEVIPDFPKDWWHVGLAFPALVDGIGI